MKITIEREDGTRFWSIHVDRDLEGDLVNDSLGFDEALGVVAALLLGVAPLPYLMSPGAQKAMRERWTVDKSSLKARIYMRGEVGECSGFDYADEIVVGEPTVRVVQPFLTQERPLLENETREAKPTDDSSLR